MFKFKYDLIVLDLEMNQPTRSIIEIGAVKLLRDGTISKDHFSSVVNPKEGLGLCTAKGRGRITITELTGITQQEVDSAQMLGNVVERFHKWATQDSPNIILAGWGGDPQWLLSEVVSKELSYPFRRKSLDVRSMVVFYSSLIRRKYDSDGLEALMRAWKLEPEGNAHRALPDALNTARLLQKVIRYHRDTWLIADKLRKKLDWSER